MLGLPEIFFFLHLHDTVYLTKSKKPTELKIQVSFVICMIFTTALLLLEGAKDGSNKLLQRTNSEQRSHRM